MHTIVEDLKKVPVSERIQIVEDIWDSIAIDTLDIPGLSASERHELDRRYIGHQNDPSTGIPWEQVRAKLFKEKS